MIILKLFNADYLPKVKHSLSFCWNCATRYISFSYNILLFCCYILGLQSYSGRTKELRQTCRQFDFVSEADCDVIQFIQKSQTDMEAMTKEFENLANVKFQPKRLTGRNCPSQYIIRFQPLPVKYVSLHLIGFIVFSVTYININDVTLLYLQRTNGQQINQKSFESECKSKIMAFLEKYTVRVGKFDPRDLDNICKSNSWRNQSDIILIEIDQRRSVSVFARYPFSLAFFVYLFIKT